MTRIKAFLIHLGISTVIFFILLTLIILVWFPSPYFTADGGWQGIRIIAGVDFILGPMLTLLIYKQGKKYLKLDLAIIGAIQTTALAFGIFTVHEQRTMLIAFADQAFYSVGAERAEMDPGIIEYVAKSNGYPRYAFVRLPEDPKERFQLTMKRMLSGDAPYTFSDLYEPVGQNNLGEIVRRSLDVEIMAQNNKAGATALAAFKEQHGSNLDDYAFLPLACRYANIVLAIRRSDGTVVDTIGIDTTPLVNFAPKK